MEVALRYGLNKARSVKVLLPCALLLNACMDTPKDPERDDTPVSGRAVVLADEDLRFLLEDHQLVFNSTYPDAEVVIHYLPEARLTKAMLADSVRSVFGSFKPGGDQEAYFRTRSLSVHVERVAMDAIAVIVPPGNPVRSLTLAQLRGMLEGGITAWPGTSTPVTPLFEHRESGVPRTLVDSLFQGDVGRLTQGKAMNNVEELVQRVAADPGAIGFLAFARISDLDDARCRALRANVRLVPIAANDSAAAHLPDQGTLKDGSYPLRRGVIMMVTEGKSGLGTGFASFVAGHKGQRIILKQGLAPERVPARDVELVHP